MFGAMVTVKNIWTKTRVVMVLRAIIALKKKQVLAMWSKNVC